LGIDLEPLSKDPELERALTLCFSPREAQYLAGTPYGYLIGFTIKEALYKCIQPLSGGFIDFLDAELQMSDQSHGFAKIVLLRSLGSGFDAGTEFIGHYCFVLDHIWAGVYLT
jgi:4'-phosphopantetheinyl transferase EntD